MAQIEEASKEASLPLIDQLCDQLQDKGQDQQALRFQEQGLALRMEIYGLQSDEAKEACAQLALMCNTLAMRCLCKEQHEDALKMLKKAETLTGPNSCMPKNNTRLKLRAVTLNNLGCFYKNRNKPHTALQYLDRALRIEATTPACHNPAGTHLNLCAILSQLGRHREAMEHAQCALELLNYGKGETEPAEKDSGGAQTSITAIAYYNLGVEQEYLKQVPQAVKSYKSAVGVAEKELGRDHAMTVGMQRSLRDAMKIQQGARGMASPRSRKI